MATTKQDIQRWLETAKEKKATHVIVVCDTFDYEDYPVYVSKTDNVSEVMAEYDGKNMQRIMEVYKVADDWEKQLNQNRCYNI